MKKTVTTLVLILLAVATFAQFPGKRSKKEVKGFDGHIYKVGEVVQLGKARNGKNFRQVYIYTHKSVLETTLNVVALDAESLLSRDITALPSKFNNYSAPIKYFKHIKVENGDAVVYAILKIKKSNQRIAVPINASLINGELISLNPTFNIEKIKEKANWTEPVELKSFSEGYKLELLSCKGNVNSQTVTIVFRVRQEGVHKKLEIYASKYRGTEAYDAEGNEYNAYEVSVGSNHSRYTASNKIPTSIPIKASLTFHKILPKVKELSYINIRVNHRDYDGGSWQKGDIEIHNLPIDWGK